MAHRRILSEVFRRLQVVLDVRKDGRIGLENNGQFVLGKALLHDPREVARIRIDGRDEVDGKIAVGTTDSCAIEHLRKGVGLSVRCGDLAPSNHTREEDVLQHRRHFALVNDNALDLAVEILFAVGQVLVVLADALDVGFALER